MITGTDALQLADARMTALAWTTAVLRHLTKLVSSHDAMTARYVLDKLSKPSFSLTSSVAWPSITTALALLEDVEAISQADIDSHATVDLHNISLNMLHTVRSRALRTVA